MASSSLPPPYSLVSSFGIIFSFLFLVLTSSAVLCKERTITITQDLINEICFHTYLMEEYIFCNNTFNANLKSTPSPGLHGLTQITIQQSLHNSTNTYELIAELLRNSTGRVMLQTKALSTCKTTYGTIIQSFRQASAYFSRRDYSRVVEAESPGLLAQERCSNAFKSLRHPSSANPLAERNKEMRILISMSIVTANCLANA